MYKKIAAWTSIIVIFGLCSVGASSMVYQNAFAQNIADIGGKKAKASLLIDCYDTGAFQPSRTINQLNGKVSGFMTNKGKVNPPLGFEGDKTNVSCRDFVDGLIGERYISIPDDKTDPEVIRTFMADGLGYTLSGSNGGKCAWFKYNITYRATPGSASGPSTGYTQRICASDINGDIVNSKLEIVKPNVDKVHSTVANGIKITFSKNTLKFCYGYNGSCGAKKNPTSKTITFKEGVTKWTDITNEFKNVVVSEKGNYNDVDIHYEIDGIADGTAIKIEDYGTVNAKYDLTVSENAKKAGTRFLVGAEYGTKPIFYTNEQFVMYQNYLVGHYNVNAYCDWNEDQANANKGYVKTRLYIGGEYKACYVKSRNGDGQVGGINGGIYGSATTWQEIAEWLNNSTISDTFSADSGIMEPNAPSGPFEPAPTPTPSPTPSEPGATADFDCDSIVKEGDGITPGKLGAMQWILCPSLNNMAYTANWIDNITQNMLEVKTDRYSTNSGTFKGWEMVRNIANVAMIVFLLVIIFSQITGYGIDNYGIKKMLPRLITMALIINISFYICEVVIDLSNISGVGLRDLFASFGEEISSGVGEDGTGAVTAGLVGIFSAFASSGPAIAAGAAAASLGWVAIVIAAVVLVLIIVVALVTLWLMLGLREIIVVACVVLSPLAFASFILPNTQNLFKKWWDLFKAAIIVYPICGAVAGISYFLRGISGDGDMGMSVAGEIILFILPYLVFFLLPMLLKNALSALGKLGGALTSMGQTIRNGGRAIGQAGVKGVQNSQRYKDWAQFRQEQVAAQRAQRIHNRLSGRTDLTRRQQSQLRNADEVLLAQSKRDKENASRATGEYYNAAMVKQDLAVGQEQRSTELYNDPNYSAMMERHGDVALHSEREKMFSESFADQDKVANTANLGRSLMGHDADEAAAAFTTLSSQGISETMGALYNANWNSMDASVRDKVLTRMSSSNIDSFKSFAKYRQSGGQKSFKDWMTGAGSVEHGVKDASFAAHLNDLKDHAMDAYSKDEMEFINKNAADSLRAQLGSQEFGSMLKSAAINSKDPKMQTQTEDILRRQIENGTMSASDLGITAENLGAMRGDTMKAIRQAYFNKYQKQGYNTANAKTMADMELRNGLSNQILDAKSDQRIYNRMDKDVKAILGI